MYKDLERVAAAAGSLSRDTSRLSDDELVGALKHSYAALTAAREILAELIAEAVRRDLAYRLGGPSAIAEASVGAASRD